MPAERHDLVNLLADCYPERESSRRVVLGVGLDPKGIPFHAAAADMWSSIVEKAALQEKLDDLLDLACEEYPALRAKLPAAMSTSRHDLANLLADCYPEPASSRRLALGAGLDQKLFGVHAIPADTWFSIVESAARQEKLGELFDLVLREQQGPRLRAKLTALRSALVPLAVPVPDKPTTTMTTTLPSLPQPLLDAYRDHRLGVLFGSGLSLAADVTGNFPRWAELPGRLLDLAEKQALWTPAQIQGRRGHFKDYVSLEAMLSELDTRLPSGAGVAVPAAECEARRRPQGARRARRRRRAHDQLRPAIRPSVSVRAAEIAATRSQAPPFPIVRVLVAIAVIAFAAALARPVVRGGAQASPPSTVPRRHAIGVAVAALVCFVMITVLVRV